MTDSAYGNGYGKDIEEAMHDLMELTSPRTVWIFVEWLNARFPSEQWPELIGSFRDTIRVNLAETEVPRETE